MKITRMPKITTAVFAGGTTLLIAGAAVAATLSPSGARMLHMADAHPASTASSLAPTTTPAPSSTSTTVPRTSPVTTSSSTAPKPEVKTRTSTTTHASTPAKKAAAKAPITYTVHRGDTLIGIATWFKLHGYGSLYAANAKTIGANPNLIHPGERITIGSHVMKVQGPA